MPDEGADSEPDSSRSFRLHSGSNLKQLRAAVLVRPLSFIAFVKDIIIGIWGSAARYCQRINFNKYTHCWTCLQSCFYYYPNKAQHNKEITIHGMDS